MEGCMLREQIYLQRLILVPVLCALALAQETASFPASAPEDIVERSGPSVVLVIARRAQEQPVYATGIVGRSDGIILTAYHAVKDAREAQVRLKNGETFDQVELIGFDARRDVAALRIPAVGLPTLPMGNLAETRAGQPVLVVSNPAGLGWSASSGIVSSVRMADEVAGAGSGYRILQFSAPVSRGSSGGVVLDGKGRALGLVVGTVTSGQNLNFAVPLESIAGLANGNGGTPLGAGTSLRLPQMQEVKSASLPSRDPAPLPLRQPDSGFGGGQPTVQPVNPSAAELSEVITAHDPNEILRKFHSIYVISKTLYAKPEVIQSALQKEPTLAAWGIVLVSDPQVADLRLTIDRPLFTFTWTYELAHQNSGIILDTTRVKGANDGVIAPKMAHILVEKIASVRGWPKGLEPEKKK
jgi:putative serine protease PepD